MPAPEIDSATNTVLKHAFFEAGVCQNAFGRSTQLIARNLELQALDNTVGRYQLVQQI